MKRAIIGPLCAGALLLMVTGPVSAWGRGGGFAVGGYRGGGVSVGGYRGGYGGGYHGYSGAVGGYRGYTGGYGVGGYRGVETYRGGYAVGGYRGGVATGTYRGAAGVGTYRAPAAVVNRGVATGHVGMATDFGFGHVAAAAGPRGYVAAGHYTTAYNPGVLAARGAAVRTGFYHYGAFNSAWWGRHPGAWRPYGWNPFWPWRWSTWPFLIGWLGWQAPPIYYDYGNTIVYQGDQVYVNGQPEASAADYYQQAATLAQSAPPLPPADKKDEEWQPLGVFSLVQGEQSDTAAVFQLAVSKAGAIGGNYYNVLTSTTLPVRGAVDKKTQRASWIVGDEKDTIYDTGIVNLTKDESPILIHFGKDRTQQWLLVRVKDKDGQAPQTETPAAPATAPAPTAVGDNIARLTVMVPDNADVFIDGSPTTQTGTLRRFNTPPLDPGMQYSYSIRARWTANGVPVEQTRTVTFAAGSQVNVDFNSPAPK